VGKSFAEKHGVELEKIFGLVSKMTSLCTLIFVAFSSQMALAPDVKNAFLNDDILEQVNTCPSLGGCIHKTMRRRMGGEKVRFVVGLGRKQI